MFKVYVGTTNVIKLEAVKHVLSDFVVEGINVGSGVSSQPKSDEETIQGAKNRALGLPDRTLRIGLEAGVEKHNDIVFLINWGVLIDEDNNVYYAGGTRIPLPKYIGERLYNEDVELADVIDYSFNREDIKHQEGTVGILTNNYVKRVDIFIHIVKLLYGQYLYKRSN